MSRQFLRAAAVLVTALPLATGCEDRVTSPRTPGPGADQLPAFHAKPGASGAAADRMLFKATMGPLEGTTSHGMVHIEIVGGYLTVSAHGTRLEPSQHTPQHIHENATCDDPGNPLINLDATLTIPGEAPSVGPAFPVSNKGGVLNYYASRSLEDLRQAVNTHFGENLTSVEALLGWLRLEQRNVHMHVPFVGTPPPPVNCGAVDRLN